MKFSIPIRLKHLLVATYQSVNFGLNAKSAEAVATASEPTWPPADPAAVAHWQSLRFGMFIHWGPVSLTGKEIGWSRGKATPIEVYDKLYQQFNPTNFNADDWVSIAKVKLVEAHVVCRGNMDAKQSDAALEIFVAEADRQPADTVVALEFDGDVMKLPAVGLANVPAEK